MNPFKYGETVGGENFCRRPEFACILKGYGDWSECSDVGRTAHGQDVPRVRDGSWH